MASREPIPASDATFPLDTKVEPCVPKISHIEPPATLPKGCALRQISHAVHYGRLPPAENEDMATPKPKTIRRKTTRDIESLYRAGQPIAMVTCYDYTFARLVDNLGDEAEGDGVETPAPRPRGHR